MINKQKLRAQRKRRIRSVVEGTAKRPRLTVFRSLRNIAVQVVDDSEGKTLISADARTLKKGTSMEKAREIGVVVAKKCKDMKIDTIVFDRNGYKYHGKVKAVADGVREGGITL